MAKSVMVSTRWDRELYRKVKEMADAERRPVAAMVREIVRRWIGRHIQKRSEQ